MINTFDEELPQKANSMLIKLNNQQKTINYERLNLKRDKNFNFDFRGYKSLEEFFKEMYYWKLSIDRAEDIQKEFAGVLTALEKYEPKPEYIDKKQSFYIMQECFIKEGR